MSNFNYDNYIGEHMDKPLMVIDGRLLYSVNMDNIRQVVENPNCKPLIKSPSDLTDNEWLFVYYGANEYNYEAYTDEGEYVTFHPLNNTLGWIHRYYFCDTNDNKFTQAQLNRLYSLHVSLDYDELILNDKAARKI